jgi:cytochrome o ubiquinol oxidase subunit IV
MHDDQELAQILKQWHGTLSSYLIGFFLSAVLTAASFYLGFTQPFRNQAMLFVLTGLGILQAIVQLWFFLHLGKESKPHWETMIFLFMTLVLLIIAVGSLWIIYDLNERVMSEMTETSTQRIYHD